MNVAVRQSRALAARSSSTEYVQITSTFSLALDYGLRYDRSDKEKEKTTSKRYVHILGLIQK
jgi:hypothetical protein